MSFDIANIGQIAARHNAQALAENNSANGGNAPKGKVAKYWLNFGAYCVNKETGERVFGSIGGIPVDTAPDRFLKSGLIAEAQASVHKDLMEIAVLLQPGQAVVIDAGVWAFELRHVRPEGTQANNGTPALMVDEERERAKQAAIARVKAAMTTS